MRFPLHLVLLAWLSSFPFNAQGAPALQGNPESRTQSAVQGKPTPVTAVVFSDFGCPYSSQLFFTLQKLHARYGDQLRVITKQDPLPIHPDAPLAHRAALAAGRQGRFEAMAELLYSNQTRQDRTSLLSYARELHLDLPRFRHDLDSPAITAQLAADLEEGRAFGVELTPTIYINGKVLSGFQSEQTLAELIDKAASRDLPGGAPHPPAASTTLDAKLAAEIQSSPATTQGAGNAPLTIVEFTDFQCPFCRSAAAPMEQLIAARPQDVRWVLRSFPLDFHLDSELAHEAALAAGEQGKFWPMHDLLFSHQSALKLADLRGYAEQLHLDLARFDDALATHRFAGQIAADRALGNRVGVNGTPTFVVDGSVMTGARSLAELTQLLDSHLLSRTGPDPVGRGTPTPVANPEHQVLGPASGAPLTLTWFTDVRSSLAANQAELIRSLATRYDGQLRIVFKAFPLAVRPDARFSSNSLLAAGKQGKFWEMYDLLASRRDVLDESKIIAIAAELKLDPVTFKADLAAASESVTADLDEGARRGIQGVPVIFLNGQRVDGLQREEFYTSMLDGQLGKTPEKRAEVRPQF